MDLEDGSSSYRVRLLLRAIHKVPGPLQKLGSRALAHRLAGSASAVFSEVELLSRNAIRLRGRAGVVRRASGPRARGAEAMQLLLQTFELALRWTSYTS